MQRRLRILTVPLSVASSAMDVFDHADAEAITAVLMHKVADAAQVGGCMQFLQQHMRSPHSTGRLPFIQSIAESSMQTAATSVCACQHQPWQAYL